MCANTLHSLHSTNFGISQSLHMLNREYFMENIPQWQHIDSPGLQEIKNHCFSMLFSFIKITHYEMDGQTRKRKYGRQAQWR